MSEWFDGYVQANDLNIHYHRTSGTGKPQLILLHGVMDNGLCWTPVARDLQVHFDVIMTDARGHGRTGGALENFSYHGRARPEACGRRASTRDCRVIPEHSQPQNDVTGRAPCSRQEV